MKLSKQDLADMLQDTVGNTLSEEEVSNAIEELESNTLEIEGYEHVQWIKFDLDDPKTFPPNDTMVLYNFKGKVYYGDFINVSKSSIVEDGVTYWRSLPNLPVEMDTGK